MAFESDAEGYQLAVRYAGHDFDKPRTVEHDLLREYWRLDYTLENFSRHMASLLESVPEEYRAMAKVEFYDQGYDSGPIFHIYYLGPEAPEAVADRVRRCVEYVEQTRRNERLAFDHLKKKTSGSEPRSPP